MHSNSKSDSTSKETDLSKKSSPSDKFIISSAPQSLQPQKTVQNKQEPAKQEYECDTYESLFQFIKKNKALKSKIDEVSVDNKKVVSLLKAIKEGNSNDQIFGDPDCDVFLLYLIKTKQIPFDQGMTLYTYLMGLMSFNHPDLKVTPSLITQPLSYSDSDSTMGDGLATYEKMKVPFFAEPLMIDEKLSSIGAEYVNKIIGELKQLHVDVNQDELVAFIRKLPPSEKWLLKCDTCKIGDFATDYDHLINALFPFSSMPSLPIAYFKAQPDGNAVDYYVPSVTLMKYLFQKMCPDKPLLPFYGFGTVGEDTVLTKLHAQNRHFIQLYSKYVKTNYIKAHTLTAGPYGVLVHDLYHATVGNLLSYNTRQQFIHIFENLKVIVQKNEMKDEAIIKLISALQHQCSDYDFRDLKQYKDPKHRLKNYFIAVFEELKLFSSEEKCLQLSSAREEDNYRLYFLLERHKAGLGNLAPILDDVYRSLTSSDRDELRIISTLVKLDKEKKCQYLPRTLEEWREWIVPLAIRLFNDTSTFFKDKRSHEIIFALENAKGDKAEVIDLFLEKEPQNHFVKVLKKVCDVAYAKARDKNSLLKSDHLTQGMKKA